MNESYQKYAWEKNNKFYENNKTFTFHCKAKYKPDNTYLML